MKDDGGPAFPQPRDIGNLIFMGMSLRDLFAGMAMQGYLAGYPSDERLPEGANLALAAYDYADAMLAEREKR